MTKTDEGAKFDIASSGVDGNRIRLPVRHRYRSPIFMEFQSGGRRSPDAFAALWLLELVDGEEHDFDLPLFRVDNSVRLSQNYITQENYKEIPDLDIEEIGRVRFRGRFSPGTDSDHIKFVSDNDSRETIEAWEACYAEGIRKQEVLTEVPPIIQKLHDESLTQGRDVLAQADEKQKQKWLAKDGTDWTGAFGKDPTELMARKGGPGQDSEEYDDFEEEESYNSDDGDDDSPDLGLQDADHDDGSRTSDATTGDQQSMGSQRTDGTDSSKKSHGPISALKDYRGRSRDLHRKHRGLMQWRPMRNAQFAKDEAKYAFRKIKTLGALDGRQPDVETEV